MRLYDLASQYQMLLDMIDEDIDNDALKIMLDGISGRFEEKAENTVKVIKSLDYDIESIKKEVDRLTVRAKTLERKREFLRDYLKNSMNLISKEKIKGALFTIWIQDSRPSVEVLDEGSVPSDYFVQPAPQLRKSMILEAWEKGIVVPGTQVKKDKSLRVK